VISFFIIKPTRFTNFTKLFWHENLLISDSSSVHRQEFSNDITTTTTIIIIITIIIIYLVFQRSARVDIQLVTQVCRQPSSRTRMELILLERCLQTCMTYTIVECTVNKLLMMDRELSETCRISCQNKFVKLVHLVGFIKKKFVTMQHGHMLRCSTVTCYDAAWSHVTMQHGHML
jgi:hypothetical protein